MSIIKNFLVIFKLKFWGRKMKFWNCDFLMFPIPISGSYTMIFLFKFFKKINNIFLAFTFPRWIVFIIEWIRKHFPNVKIIWISSKIWRAKTALFMHIDIILRLSKKIIFGPLKNWKFTSRCLKIETTNEQKTRKVRF